MPNSGKPEFGAGGRVEAKFAVDYFAGSAGRDVQVISAGWHAMPIFEQLMASASARAQLRHLSVQARQVLSRSP